MLQWLASEIDGDLLEVLHRFGARAKGCRIEGPRTDIELDELEKYHLAVVDDLLEGTRSDEYPRRPSILDRHLPLPNPRVRLPRGANCLL
ncbi:MAG: hypothetical protein V3V08_06285 [Nannocystaceae bacterium]